MKSRNHKDIPFNKTSSVHITWTERTENICLRGYAISSETGIKKEYAKQHKVVAKNIEDIPIKQDHLYHLVCAEIQSHERSLVLKESKNKADTKSVFELALDEVEQTPSLYTNWSPGYAKKIFVYFRLNMLPILLKEDNVSDWGQEEINELQANIVDKILKTKRSSGDEATAKITASKTLAAMDRIYRLMCTVSPDLPIIDFCPSHTGPVIQNEQIKSIPEKVRQKFISLVESFIFEDPRTAFAVILMESCGLRTGEAAGTWHDCFLKIEDDIMGVLVQYQVKNGSRINILKNENAYRLIPVNSWGKAMLELCLGELPNDTDRSSFQPCNPHLLSKKIKEMLTKAGLSKQDFFEAEHMMNVKPDYDSDGKPIKDVNAYILRRDFSSRLRNICGASSVEIDYLLGHRKSLPKKMCDDFRKDEAQVKLALKLERYVLNPKYSKHPYYNPIILKHGVDLDLSPFNAYCMRNSSNEPVDVKLDLEAVLNADAITIITPKGSLYHSKERSTLMDRSHFFEPLIGDYIRESGDLTNEENE